MFHRLSRLLLVALVASLAAAAPAADGRAQESPPRVLVFSATYGFRHPSIATGNATLMELAQETGAFAPTFTENPADFTAENLRDYDLVLWNQTTGRFPFSADQRATLARYWGCGGGTMGLHAAADANYGWPAYAELWGAQFSSHPQGSADPQVKLLVENADHPVNAGYAGLQEWMHRDELYRWQRDVRGRQDVTPLLALDEGTVRAGVQDGAEFYWDDQPLSWTKTFRGAGRVYYNNLGHNDATYERAEYRRSLVDGISWVSEVGLDAACFDGDQELPGPERTTAPAAGTEPCVLESGQTAVTLDAPGEQEVTGVAAPRYFGYGKRSFVLDLSGSAAQAADVTVELSWLLPANDYDLGVTAPGGFAGSDAAQPDGTTTETAVLEALPHCTEFLVSAYNWAAVNPGDGDAPQIVASAVAAAAGPGPAPAEPPPSAPAPQPTEPAPAGVERSAGADRVATAAAISASTRQVSSVVVLARADQYADALAGAPLAAQLGGPLLLTAGDRLSQAAAVEISRLGASDAVLLGGEAALSPRVAGDLAAAGVRTRRVAGSDRFTTAAAIAGELPATEAVYLVEGANADPSRGWPDALSAAGAAASLRVPVLLATRDSLPAATAERLEGRAVTVVGGPAAISVAVEQAAEERASSISRLGGATRYGTSAAVAEDALRRGATAATTWVATGSAFADGLGAGAAAGAAGGTLVLIDGRDLDGSSDTRAFLQGQVGSIRSLHLAGGEQAIAQPVEDELRTLVGAAR